MPNDTTYPIVHRLSDPLVIRPCELALQVNDTTYYAKIKFGISFCGFLVYANPTGYPVYTCIDEDLTKRWAGDSKSATPSITETYVEEYLNQKAKEWIDSLEQAILEHRSDNEIKKAIDRLLWQLHYDITQSDTDFVETFPDFSDIDIDKPNNTLYNTITESADILGTAVGDGAEVIIGNPTDNSGIWSVSNNISSVGNSLSSALNTLTTSIGTLDNNLSGSNGSIKKYIGEVLYKQDDENTVCNRLNKVATNIKGDSDTYTISVALRESGQSSVSQAVHDQTTMEQQRFTTLDESVGDVKESIGNKTTNNSLWYDVLHNSGTKSATETVDNDSIAHDTEFVKELMYGDGGTKGGYVTWDQSSSTYRVKSDNASEISTISQTVSHINSNLGTDANHSGTVWYDLLHNVGTGVATANIETNSLANRVQFMRELMFGDGATYNGYVERGSNTYYVKTSG